MTSELEAAIAEAWLPLGAALLDYHRGRTDATFVVTSSLWEDEITSVADYYRPASRALPEIEDRALGLCRGHVLDLGAGAGRHALELQKLGHRVTAVELSPDAVEVMRERGVRDARCADLYSIQQQRFDTILLLMNGLGVVGTLAGLDRFLRHAAALLSPGGRIVCDSADLSAELREAGLDLGSDRTPRHRRYPGEVSFRLRYGDLEGAPYPWLFVDSQTLRDAAAQVGMALEVAARGSRGAFLAIIEPLDMIRA